MFERMQVFSRSQKALRFEGMEGFLFILVWQSSWLEGKLWMPLAFAPVPPGWLLGGPESRKSSEVGALVAVLPCLRLLCCKDSD